MHCSPVPQCTAFSDSYEGWTLERGGHRGITRSVSVMSTSMCDEQKVQKVPTRYISAQKGRRRVLRSTYMC